MAATMRGAVCRLSNIHLRYKPAACVVQHRYNSQIATELQDEAVEYPPIRPKYPPGRWSSDISPAWAWWYHGKGQELLKLPDVRERLEALAGEKDRYLYIVRNWDSKVRTLPYKQYITRTHIIHDLPNDVYANVDVSEGTRRLKPLVEDLILQESEQRYAFHIDRNRIFHNDRAQLQTSKFVGSLLDLVLTVCGYDHEHLLQSQLDQGVRLESFWRVGGYDRPHVWNSRLWMQGRDRVAFQIRTEKPLPQFASMDDEICQGGKYPDFNYFPCTQAQKREKDRPISVSGHWVGDPCEFTHLHVQVPGRRYQQMLKRFEGRTDLLDEAWLQSGLTSSFVSCCAQAHNQGFNVYFDVTEPFTSQTMLCLGNEFQFFNYQLNTMHMWLRREDNPHNNVLWAGPKQKLFQSVEGGKVRGFDDQVLQQILKFVLLKSADRQKEMRPHLTQDDSPVTKTEYINTTGQPPLPVKKIERWQYPRKAVYF